MSWFQLDPQSIASRVRSSASGEPPPSLGKAIVRGMIGFTLLSVAGFAPWAFFGRWMYRNVGEVGLYLCCALVFIGLSAPLLHRLIIGPDSMSRFYKLFAVAFSAYSAAWIAGWLAFRGHTGSVVGLFAGAAVMGVIFAGAFVAWRMAPAVVAVLFLLNAAGYFIGGWFEAALFRKMPIVAMLMWGVCYGLGFGAGLGAALHLCQTKARELLRREST